MAKAFQEYRTAVLDNDGESAWHVVNSGTKDFYSQCLDHARILQKADLYRLQFFQRSFVLRLRNEFRKSALQRMNGHELFILAVKNGWVDKTTVDNILSLDNLAGEDVRARAYHPKDSKRTMPLFHFVREENHWKLALWKSFPIVNAWLLDLLRKEGMSEDEFIRAGLTAASQYAFDDRIYDGPLD